MKTNETENRGGRRAGSGRRKGEAKETVSVYMRPPAIAELRARAAREKMSAGDYIEKLMDVNF